METAEAKTRVSAYVIMPFSKTSDGHTQDYWNEHYSDFIEKRLKEVVAADPMLARFEWDVKRSSTVRGGPLNYEIVWDLLWANIVIADLTDLNANVLYELGIRHALTAALNSARTIMIQDEASFKLPFDFANYAVLKYCKSKVDTWKRDLTDRLNSCLSAFQYRDNPVAMTFAQHGYSMQPGVKQNEQMASMKAALDMIERMKTIGFEVKWIQELIGAAFLKDHTTKPGVIVTTNVS